MQRSYSVRSGETIVRKHLLLLVLFGSLEMLTVLGKRVS